MERHMEKLAEKKISAINMNSLQTEKSYLDAQGNSELNKADNNKSGSLFQTERFKGAIQNLMGPNSEDQAKAEKAAAEKERNQRLRVRGNINKGNPQEEIFNLLKNFKGVGSKYSAYIA